MTDTFDYRETLDHHNIGEHKYLYNDEKDSNLMIGGTIDTPSFALLAGICKEKHGAHPSKVSIPIRRIPTIMGRKHITKNANFVGIGLSKSISRKHVAIYYQNHTGEIIGYFNTGKINDSLEKKCRSVRGQSYVTENNGTEKDVILHPFIKDVEKKSKHGFFVIKCLGKNRIQVGKKWIHQEQVALLQSGTPIRIAHFNLYFILPRTTGDLSKVLSTPVSSMECNDNKRKRYITGHKNHYDDANTKLLYKRSKGLVNCPDLILEKDVKLRGYEYDKQPINFLLDEFHKAIDSGKFERKHQILSSAIMLRAVKDAASDKKLQKSFKEVGALSRLEIINWIAESPLYRNWVDRTLSKFEAKSYRANISKSLVKAGYTRLGTTGRHVKWVPPCNIH